MTSISTLGAIAALVVAIVLILRKVSPAYGMMAGALVGGLIGGADLLQTVSLMVSGAQGIVNAVLRILAAGVLAGVLIESGAANTIAETIVRKVGETRALLALAIATLCLTAVGVFIDVAVITVAPIALSIARNAGLSKSAIMLAGVVPGIVGLIIAYLLAKRLNNKGAGVADHEVTHHDDSVARPGFLVAISAPLVAIFLLSLRPFAGISIDPLIALPVGGLVGLLLMGRARHCNQYMVAGLMRMAPVAIMLLGTGTLAGIIANSELKDVLIHGLTASGLPSWLLAPVSGAMMSMATASTTAGTAVASGVFSPTLLELGVSALAGAAMIHAGATVLDHLPHGSFFHATGGSVNMQIHERLKLMPYETLVGLAITFISTLMFGFFGFAG
ncbi:TPA: GntP family permease [Salmonella enterica subsp. enterica serovar Derby]|nr:GntP family permease [Salmonella enterica]HEE9434945.1 GntP family permease [Salmonella enterica subsp. enterica serovar Derby]